jgi:putative endonuclease
MGYVYILESLKNGSLYIGSTVHLEVRLIEHAAGKSTYTSHLLPFKKVFSQQYTSLKQARKAELWLKKQKDKDFLKRIIQEGRIERVF